MLFNWIDIIDILNIVTFLGLVRGKTIVVKATKHSNQAQQPSTTTKLNNRDKRHQLGRRLS